MGGCAKQSQSSRDRQHGAADRQPRANRAKRSQFGAEDKGGTPSPRTPCGVTTSGSYSAKQSQLGGPGPPGRGAGGLFLCHSPLWPRRGVLRETKPNLGGMGHLGKGQSRKTKPILAGGQGRDALATNALRRHYERELFCETKPMWGMVQDRVTLLPGRSHVRTRVNCCGETFYHNHVPCCESYECYPGSGDVEPGPMWLAALTRSPLQERGYA